MLKLGAHLTKPEEILNEKNLFKKELCLDEAEKEVCYADIDKFWYINFITSSSQYRFRS